MTTPTEQNILKEIERLQETYKCECIKSSPKLCSRCNLISKKEAKLEGYQLAQKETAEKVKKLKKYFNCSPLECEKIDKIFKEMKEDNFKHLDKAIDFIKEKK